MQGKGNITIFFDGFQEIHLLKDPFLVPYYLGKALNHNVTLLYPRLPDNGNLPNTYRNVQLIPLELIERRHYSIRKKYSNVIDYVVKHASEIDVLMLFFGDYLSEILTKEYKKNNPRGKVYIKLDINPYGIRAKFWEFPFDWTINNILRSKFFSLADVASCETQLAYDKIKSGRIRHRKFGSKLVLAPNGVDEEEIQTMGLGNPDYSQKENIMLTVARLGTYEKNTEMLLDAIGKLKLREWKFYLIGPVDENFKRKKELFMSEHPDLAEKIIWTGPIIDRHKLYGLLNKSKVFVLTSRFESYGLVLIEAQRFGNYLISTPVGAAQDVINNTYGQIVPNGDSNQLAATLQDIIDNNARIDDAYSNFDYTQLSWEKRLEKVIERLRQ